MATPASSSPGGHKDAAIQAMETAREAIDEAMRGLRESLVDLRKSAVEQGGLVTTIEQFADQVGMLWGAQVRIVGELKSEPPDPGRSGRVPDPAGGTGERA